MCVASFNFAQKCCENESAKFDLFRTLGRDDQTFLASISILSLSRAQTLPSRVRNSSEWKFFEKGGFIFYVKWMKNAKPFLTKKSFSVWRKRRKCTKHVTAVWPDGSIICSILVHLQQWTLNIWPKLVEKNDPKN